MAPLKTNLKLALEKLEGLEKTENQKNGNTSAELKLNFDTRNDTTAVDVNENLKSVSTIPPFYTKIPGPNEPLSLKIRESARALLLERKSDELLNHEELTEFYRILENFASPPQEGDGDDKFMSFRNYKKMIPTLSEKYQQILTTEGVPAFAKLFMNGPPFPRVQINTLFNYAMRKTWLRETRIALSMYDDTGQGFVKYEQMENYIKDLIPTMTQLKDMDSNLLPFYLVTAARKFFFFLDINRMERIKIIDILASGLIDELLDLREEEPPPITNWFSFESMCRVYQHFIQLDKDRNGLLSQDEFVYYSSGEMNLTPTFVSRLYDECITFEREMDYRTYLEFVLAVENPYELQSMKFFFKIMDIHHNGYLDAFTLQYFYKDILHMMEIHNAEKIPFNDVKDEMFDMIKPKDPMRITLNDLLRSGCGRILFSVFTDYNGFWAHELREASFVDTLATVGSPV